MRMRMGKGTQFGRGWYFAINWRVGEGYLCGSFVTVCFDLECCFYEVLFASS
jgi:hypothetical protein